MPTIESWGGFKPVVPASSWVHPSVVLIGDVVLGERVSVWPGVVLRGDQGRIVIGDETNIQDGTIAHATGGISTVRIGARCTVGHRVILHGCEVGDDCLVGMGSIVLDNARIAPGSIVGAGALVAVGMQVPPGVLVLGMPAKVVRTLGEVDHERIAHGHQAYLMLLDTHTRRAG
jgi:carbonic anhydrase/acetyltransferase-like protein (isoleucine patch superfamily)